VTAFAEASDLVLPDGLEEPPDVDRLLEAATRALLTGPLVTALYDVDDNSLPTDAGVAEVFRQATVAQAAFMVETGDEQGVASLMKSASISGGPSWTGAIPRVSPVAVDLIRSGVDSAGASILQGPLSWT